MLQRIRANLQGIIARVIIGLITIPFVLWGVDAFFLDSGNPDVAEVNGKSISELELNQQVYRQRQQMLARMGDKVDASQLDETLLRGPVLEQMIQQRLLESAAESRGLVISERMVDQAITQQTDFQEDGKFSPQRFDVLIRSSGMTPTNYKEAMKMQLLVNQLISGTVATEFVTDADMALAASISGQKRDIEYALLTVDRAMATVSLGEQEVRSYFDAHPDDFVTDETVAVEYIELRLEDFNDDIEESEVRAAYEASIADAELATRRRAAHILLEVEDGSDDEQMQIKLAGIAERIAAGEAFSDLAREFSQDVGSREMGGDLGYSDGTAFPETFEAALADLQTGEVSSPLKTDAGWHLVMLTELEQAEVPSFESRREEIRQQLQLVKAEPAYAVKLEELKDISFNAADLQSVAEQLQIRTSQSSQFSRDGSETGLFADSRLVAEAFTSAVLEQGANSEVVELSPTHALVLRIAERVPAEPIAFAQVESELSARLLKEKATAYMEQRAQDMVTAVEGGQLLSVLAESEGVNHEEFEAISRNNIAGIPMEIAAAAFQLSPPIPGGSSYSVKTLEDGNVAVIAVDKVEPGSLADLDEASRASMKRVLGQYRAERIIQGYRASLQASADVKIL